MRLDFKRLARLNPRNGPREMVKTVLPVLAALNLAAAGFVYMPAGGSAEDLDHELAAVRAQVQTQQANLIRMRTLAAKVERARTDQESFVAKYFLDRRTASSTILDEIGEAARRSGLRPREHSFQFEPIEGSDIYSMMTISANYEGSYGDLIEFVNLLDRSRRFLIIENIIAAPQQLAGALTARFKINTFIRETNMRGNDPRSPGAGVAAAAAAPPHDTAMAQPAAGGSAAAGSRPDGSAAASGAGVPALAPEKRQ